MQIYVYTTETEFYVDSDLWQGAVSNIIWQSAGVYSQKGTEKKNTRVQEKSQMTQMIQMALWL